MLKKEFINVLKLTILFCLVIAILPVILLATKIISDMSYIDVFFPVLYFGMSLVAIFMGVSLFTVDRRQGGMEYILSLPYSRLKLLSLKILPRFIIVLIFYIAALASYKLTGEDYPVSSVIYFTIIYFSLFLIAISLSANSDKFFVLSIISIFFSIIYFALPFLMYWGVDLIKGSYFLAESSTHWPFLFAAVVLVLPFIISFILSFRRPDIRPVKVYNRRYFKYFAPILALGLIFSFLLAYIETEITPEFYYLTQDHKLIEPHGSKVKIYEKDTVHEIKGEYNWSPFTWPFFEENEFLYDTLDWPSRKIARLNTSDYTCDILYETPPEKEIGRRIRKYNQTIAFLERDESFSDIQLVLLDEPSKSAKKIPLKYPSLKRNYRPTIFGTDRTNDKRFWLICSERNWENILLRLWEDGKIENIGKSQKSPCYVNHMLITYAEEEIVISKEKEGSFETIQKIPNSEDFHFTTGFSPEKLSDVFFKEIYGRKLTKYARLNLETFEIQQIGELKGNLWRFAPDDCYFVETDHIATAVKVYKLKEGRLQLLRSFTDFDTQTIENRFKICKAGVVIKKGNKIKVYAFPDLKEIEFKNL